MADVPNVLI